MKLFTFIARISNSTIIEVEADTLEQAEEIAYFQLYEVGVISDICNPSDVYAELELETEEDGDQ